MINIDWKCFLEMSIEKQVEIVNNELSSNDKITLSYISEQVFKQQKNTLSKRFRKNGYVFKDRQYIKDSFEENEIVVNNNLKMTKEDTSNQKNTKVSNSNKKNTLEMYSIINDTLIDMDTKDVERSTVKMTKETTERLDNFLKQYKILNKQDVISVAVELFLNKYYN